MKHIWLAALSVALMAGSANAAERYTEARIFQIETSELGTYLFLEAVSGDAPPSGNGGTNEPLSKPYLLLARTAQEQDARKPMLACALVGLTQGTTLRFRWDDAGTTPYLITHILVRR